MDIERDLHWIGHASFYIDVGGKSVFIDPFDIRMEIKVKADLILITHSHFDHCSKEDVGKIISPSTEIITAPGCLDNAAYKHITIARPGFSKSMGNISIEAIPAYNNRDDRLSFHPRANNWVGYILTVDGKKLYHAGDTDYIEEMNSLNGIYAALLPIGGKYTMDVDEASLAAKAIGAEVTIPMHYKHLLGIEGSAAAEKKFAAAVRGVKVMKEVQKADYSPF
ncbi:MAG: MBL fold metallo-hydrolase [Candidatus Micrarchaeaceae archaeon]|nr:MBL fold metallo-hydrolase [Candidatus Marsarchaeota archaeon]MCL5122564.1 MBL fold metallo-hydrolase [Candidatus Marsarchaeota archaeon]